MNETKHRYVDRKRKQKEREYLAEFPATATTKPHKTEWNTQISKRENKLFTKYIKA